MEASKQNTIACIVPSGPNSPPVIKLFPVILVVRKLLVFSLPEVIAPKKPDCIKCGKKNHKLVLSPSP